jgi:hypothetical protein
VPDNLDSLMAANGTPWCNLCQSYHAGQKCVRQAGASIEAIPYGPSDLRAAYKWWRILEDLQACRVAALQACSISDK